MFNFFKSQKQNKSVEAQPHIAIEFSHETYEKDGVLYIDYKHCSKYIPSNILLPAKIALTEKYPRFKCDIVAYDPRTHLITFYEYKDVSNSIDGVLIHGDYITAGLKGLIETGVCTLDLA